MKPTRSKASVSFLRSENNYIIIEADGKNELSELSKTFNHYSQNRPEFEEVITGEILFITEYDSLYTRQFVDGLSKELLNNELEGVIELHINSDEINFSNHLHFWTSKNYVDNSKKVIKKYIAQFSSMPK